MNIFQLRDQLIQSYQSFSRSFTKILPQDIRDEVHRECVIQKRYWPEPLLQINPCYQTGKSVPELSQSGKLHPLCAKIFVKDQKPITLYKHQEQAIDFAQKHESYVVTTGTGSGKSLTFFIPIVDRILREKEAEQEAGTYEPRTRAIVLYPMNALANSQYEEIEKYLKNVSGEVTVGRYTSQDKKPVRDELKANPPDILLTNFMMLELVLMRGGDRVVVDHCKGLEFLVLDELHTYRGRQGSDVAMLVRRLRTQLAADDLICIGTSATMASGKTRREQNQAVAKFATKIFGTQISEIQVISETLQRVTDPSGGNGILRRAVLEAAAGQPQIPDYDAFRRHPLAIWIEQTLSVTPEMVRAEPRSLKEVIRALADTAGVTDGEAEQALKTFLSSFGNKNSLRTPDGRNPLPFKLHQFLSGPGKVYVTLEAPGKRFVTLDGQAFSMREDLKVRLFEVVFCRECGEEYIPVWAMTDGSNSIIGVVPRDMDDTTERTGAIAGYLTPTRSKQKYQGDALDLPDDWITYNSKGQAVVKRDLRKYEPRPVVLDSQGWASANGTAFWFLPGKFRLCINCFTNYTARGKDKNRLIGLSGEGRSSTTSVLTLELLELLNRTVPADPKNELRKMLGFSDNRQDAALQAGHFNDFIDQLILRGGLVCALHRAGRPLTLTEVTQTMMQIFGFDDPQNARAKAEYLINSANVFGTMLSQAQDVVRFTISYKLLLDLRNLDLYTCPSLEKLGLLKVIYRDLDVFCRDDKHFSQAPTLKALKPDERFKFLETFLYDIRRRQCIASRCFLRNDQTAMRALDTKLVMPRWTLFSDLSQQLSNGQDFTFDERYRKARVFNGFIVSERSHIVRTLAKLPFVWQSNGARSLTSSVFDVLREGVNALLSMGLLSASSTACGLQYRIHENALLWSAPTSESGTTSNNYFRDLYLRTAAILETNADSVFEFEAQEHTAQVSVAERELFEMRFRCSDDDKKKWKTLTGNLGPFKRLPVLYCSPTMELGIDISALNYVYMRNVPPTAANYVQRAGRAGRSGDQALTVTYCATQSPHDQWFFKHPAAMVQGVINEPTLDFTNEALVKAHLHSLWMTATELDLEPSVVAALDMSDPKRIYPLRADIQQLIHSQQVRNRAVRLGEELIRSIANEIVNEPWYGPGFVDDVMATAPDEFDRAFDSWRSLYNATITQMEKANAKLMGQSTPDEMAIARRRFNEAVSQKTLLCQTNTTISNSDFYIYRYLANQGFLPGYNFPAMPMLAWIPAGNGMSRNSFHDDYTFLSRARFLGISEFGPHNLIYHRGRIFRIVRLKINAAPGAVSSSTTLPTESTVVCPHCGYSHPMKLSVIYNQCENCGGRLGTTDVLNDLYKVTMVETEETERISVEDENRQAQGFELQTLYRFSTDITGRPHKTTASLMVGTQCIAKLTYAPAASLMRVNLGWRNRTNKTVKGFGINPISGLWSQAQSSKPAASPKDPFGYGTAPTQPSTTSSGYGAPQTQPSTAPCQNLVPYVSDVRNILLIAPTLDKVADPTKTMATLQAALKRAIEQYYQVESSEVCVESLPSHNDRKSLLVYESGEGGSGILRDLVGNPDAFKAVAELALHIMHYEKTPAESWDPTNMARFDRKPSCLCGCYDCLLTFSNQPDHEFIDRRDEAALRFLTAVASSGVTVQHLTVSTPGSAGASTSGAGTSAAPTGASSAAPAPDATTLWDRFKVLLVSRGCALPDQEPKTFKRLGLTFDAAYSAHRCVLSTTPISAADLDALQDFSWTVIDLADETSWDSVINNHPAIFGVPSQP